MSTPRWERIARLEPYYSVLSDARFLRSRFREARAAFFDSGDAEVAQLLSIIRDARIHTVLEFGCGPGRLLPAFCRRGFAVTAVDIAPSMLKLAREVAPYARVLDLAAFERDEQAFDLVNVSRVLQHIDPAEGVRTLRMLTKRLAPGGLLHLNVPFRTSRGTWSRAALSLRERMPPLNAIANRMRHRPAHVPVLAPHVYALDDVMLALHDGACEIVELRVIDEGELTVAHVLARNTVRIDEAATELTRDDSSISPEELIRTVGIDELNARAERYFARMTDWTQQLAKPFGTPAESPLMLISLGVMLHHAAIAPGMTVLDFGGGTGWLSRFLLQFGCRVILCDVAPRALAIARDFVKRHPPIGGNADDLSFSLFDGYRLDLADEEVDRIVCFDAFHHVPNVDAALREFGRVLKPGGIAAFSEPGRRHSTSPQSQFEMRVHGVLENDVDVHRIWSIARDAGFDDIRMTAYHGAPPAMALDEFDDFVRGGGQLHAVARALRDFASNVSAFTLHKRGSEKRDSRVARGLSCAIAIELEGNAFTARIANTGTAEWLPAGTSPGGVSLGAHLYRDGVLIELELLRLPLEGVQPGEVVTVRGVLPPLPQGNHTIEFDCVAEGVAWFAQVGSPTVRMPC